MRVRHLLRHASYHAAVLSALLGLLFGGTFAAVSPYVVSQKGREFRPAELAIQQGDTVEIVNDDSDLLHHAYINAPQFDFDSGDQAPGSKTSITFRVKGTFNVLCAIHPKMKLIVHVN